MDATSFAPPFGKRIVDILVALPMLVLTAPILLFAIAFVWLVDPGKVLLRQVRIGQNGLPFSMFKIRTMFEDSDDAAFREFNTRELLGKATPNDNLYRMERDDRVIPGGRFLRRHSIDELPQLLNVLRGDMSLVGPRPALPWEVELFDPDHLRRHDFPPGITGLWQVSGRNRLTMPQMLNLDLLYIEQHSVWLDLKILLRTLPAVLRGDTL
jgi:lipopolysaccharide/colanic/teichoic acid biosynthesis glycosyltransferase